MKQTADSPKQRCVRKQGKQLDQSSRRRSDEAACAAGCRLKLVHITKTAGTALEKWGLKHGFRWGRYWPRVRAPEAALYPPHEKLMKCERWHTPARFFVRNPYDGFLPFTVVRDPYTRIISEFRCPWKGYNAPKKASSKCRADACRSRQSASRTELNAWVQQKLQSGAARPPFKNGHFIPQYMYVYDETGRQLIPSNYILRFENLDAEFKSLLAQHGWEASGVAHVNDSDMPRFTAKDLTNLTCQLIEHAKWMLGPQLQASHRGGRRGWMRRSECHESEAEAELETDDGGLS
eukprot:1048149-Amphidinium_carterae.1